MVVMYMCVKMPCIQLLTTNMLDTGTYVVYKGRCIQQDSWVAPVTACPAIVLSCCLPAFLSKGSLGIEVLAGIPQFLGGGGVNPKCAAHICKLARYGFEGQTVQWIRNQLDVHNQKAVVSGSMFRQKPMISSVPEGPILGSVFFILHFACARGQTHHCAKLLVFFMLKITIVTISGTICFEIRNVYPRKHFLFISLSA